MSRNIERLVKLGTAALGDEFSEANGEVSELGALLRARNGFFAFESALHVFHSGQTRTAFSVEDWNRPDLWIADFEGAADGMMFFAEDVFGCQFGLRGGAVVSFDPETGRVKDSAESLEDWAALILDDFEFLTGWPLASEWQKTNRPLRAGERLAPTQPFFLGGEFHVSNLHATDAATAMRLKAAIFRQTRDLPDGVKVRYVVRDGPQSE